MSQPLAFDPADGSPAPEGVVSNPRNPRMAEGMVVVDVDVTTTPSPPPPNPDPDYLAGLLARTNRRVISGALTTAVKIDSPGDRFLLDGRGATCYYDENDSTGAPIAIGKGSQADSPAVVGARVFGRIPWDSSWQTVKDRWDAAAVRLEGKGTLYCYGVAIRNIEDGFEPHPAVNPNGNLTNTFVLERAYLEHIRDDAIENDQGMPGLIRDVYVEVCNRFLSEQLDSQGITNTAAVVRIDRCFVHMAPMPNARASDGQGYGGVFKWQGNAGKVAVTDSVFLLDEPPIATNAWPGGTYVNTRVVLGPKYPGTSRPSYLPSSVIVTRDLTVWTDAVAAFRARFPDLVL